MTSIDIASRSGIRFTMTDVFGARPFSGNPLPVVFSPGDLDASSLLRITQEFGQFETVFLTPTNDPGRWRARVFDLIEELPFAGHPLLGAAAAIADARRTTGPSRIELLLGERRVTVDVARAEGHHVARLDAGRPEMRHVGWDRVAELLGLFGLSNEDVVSSLRPAVVDTGLRYLVVPVTPQGLARAAIRQDIGELVRREGAQFAVLVDVAGREIRHWNNDGRTEDIATGSAASVVGAYLVASGVAAGTEPVVLGQGRFLDRPSVMTLDIEVSHGDVARVHLGGNVHVIGRGILETLP